jgi:hypothetical protein
MALAAFDLLHHERVAQRIRDGLWQFPAGTDSARGSVNAFGDQFGMIFGLSSVRDSRCGWRDLSSWWKSAQRAGRNQLCVEAAHSTSTLSVMSHVASIKYPATSLPKDFRIGHSVRNPRQVVGHQEGLRHLRLAQCHRRNRENIQGPRITAVLCPCPSHTSSRKNAA